MQVDLVLHGAGTYWRKRVELSAPPGPGEEVAVGHPGDAYGVVVGGSTPFEDDGTVASVLLRARAGPVPAALGDQLRRNGWHPLL